MLLIRPLKHKRRFGLVAAIWKSSSHQLSGVDDGIRLLVFWMRQVSPSAVAKSKNLPSQINGLVASGKYLVPGCNGVAVGLVTVIGRVADLPDLEGLIHAPLAAKPGAKVFALDSNRWLSCKGDKMGPGFKIEIREDTLRVSSYTSRSTKILTTDYCLDWQCEATILCTRHAHEAKVWIPTRMHHKH